MRRALQATGFTLIEVMVALLIVALVAGSALAAVNNYIAQRHQLQQRFMAQAVAWQPVLQAYRASRGWLAPNEVLETRGNSDTWGQQWRWQLRREPTVTPSVFRYQATVYSRQQAAENPIADGILAAYWVDR